MSDFLPKEYDVPSSKDNYMRFQSGDNRFRVLASPIIGWESWETKNDGSRTPIRHRMDEPFKASEVEDPEQIKHFWAMPVWNYDEERIQILEITQKGIQRTIRALSKDTDWGSPVNYDLVVTKQGEKLKTEYSVQPKPVKKLDPGIVQLFSDMSINMEALFTNGDPFADLNKEEVNPDDIPEDLGN